MKIAIDIREAAGQKAGKGWYTFHLVWNLIKSDSKNDYILYTQNKIPGLEAFKNARQKEIKGKGIFWHLQTLRDLKKEEIDLFFAPTSYIIPAFLPANIKSLVTVHDLVAFLFPENHNKKAVILEKIFLKRALKKGTKILAVSKSTARDLQNHFSVKSHKIEVISAAASQEFKPIPTDQLTNFSNKTKLPKKFFLAIGTLQPRKNYLHLIQAFAKVVEKYPEYSLIIVGAEGWQSDEIRDEIDRLYLAKKVHLLGYLSNSSLLSLYNLAEAFVFPSFYEGFGIPPLEAMQCGCPVIATHTSSLPEVVGDSALLIDPHKPLQITNAMIRIIEEPGLKVKLRDAGIIQSQKFSWHYSAQKLLQLIKNI